MASNLDQLPPHATSSNWYGSANSRQFVGPMDYEAVADFNHRSVVVRSVVCGGIYAWLYMGTGVPVGRHK